MRVTRRAALRSLGAAGLAGVVGVGAYGFGVGRRRFAVTQTTVVLPALPDGLSGLRVGLISDIHCGEFMPVDRVAEAADLLMAERPDVIVLGGDNVTWADTKALLLCADALAGLSAPLGIFAVYGNHDPEGVLEQVFESRGRIEVLRDRHAVVRTRGEAISLGGIRFWTQRKSDIGRVFKGAPGFPILLSHDPRRLVQARELRIPLVLSGHTHGGQVVLPLIGAPTGWRFPVLSGLAHRDKTTIYVTRGLGTVVVPVRFNCRPEISILTLERVAVTHPVADSKTGAATHPA